jgi:hypothetical protein
MHNTALKESVGGGQHRREGFTETHTVQRKTPAHHTQTQARHKQTQTANIRAHSFNYNVIVNPHSPRPPPPRLHSPSEAKSNECQAKDAKGPEHENKNATLIIQS